MTCLKKKYKVYDISKNFLDSGFPNMGQSTLQVSMYFNYVYNVSPWQAVISSYYFLGMLVPSALWIMNI